MTTTELAADLRKRINTQYAAQIGTESYERRLCAEAIEGLLATVAERDAEIGLLNGTLDSRNRNIETLSEVSAAQRKVLETALKALQYYKSAPGDFDCHKAIENDQAAITAIQEQLK